MACDGCSVEAQQLEDARFRRVLWIALVLNAAMFVVEIIASALADSMSLQADALDFFADAANYAISLLVVGASLTARAKASLVKGASMAVFGMWVLAAAGYRALYGSAPDADTMGAIAVLALVVNVGVAVMLYRYRGDDSNRTSIWLCSRNDAINNVAVLVAAVLVAVTSSRWPDLVVAVGIAWLCLASALRVLRLARAELRQEAEVA